MKNNIEIKELAWLNRVAFWRIAEKLNVCENTIVRWLRVELSEEKYQKIRNAITEIVADRNDSISKLMGGHK